MGPARSGARRAVSPGPVGVGRRTTVRRDGEEPRFIRAVRAYLSVEGIFVQINRMLAKSNRTYFPVTFASSNGISGGNIFYESRYLSILHNQFSPTIIKVVYG